MKVKLENILISNSIKEKTSWNKFYKEIEMLYPEVTVHRCKTTRTQVNTEI